MKKPLAWVTDHAVLRYLERTIGIDVEAVRHDLGLKVDEAIRQGAAATVSDGIRYILVEDRLVSCVPVKGISLRRGRQRRHRAAENEA